MPTYEITAPDGSTYEVTAPEGASVSDVLAYAQENYSTLSQEPTPQVAPTGEDVSKKGSFVAGAADMASMGFVDEMSGALAGVTQAFGNVFGQGEEVAQFLGSDTTDPMGAAQHQTGFTREAQAQAQEQNPYSYLGGQVAGALMPYGGAAKGGIGLVKGAGIGGIQGGLYGAGSGTGAPEERIGSVALGGGLGLAGGVGGVLAGRQLGRLARTEPVRRLADRAKSIFQNKQPAQQLQQVPVRELSKVSKSGDDVFSMTKGQKTQMPKAQRLEADALAGIYGGEAERAIRQSQIAQSRERQAFISQLGKLDDAGDAGDVLDGVFSTIKGQSKKLKGEVGNAYDLARQGGGTKVSTNDIKDGLLANIVNLKREGQYDLNMLPQANTRAKELAKLVRKSEGGRFTNANLSTLENWRKRVTNSLASTQDKTEKSFLGGMLSKYDDFMYKTANEAVDVQDEKAILAFRDAVKKRREYGQLYESDRFVQDLVSGKKGLDDAVKDLIGTGSIVGKKRMESTYDAILKAAGSDNKLVKADLQTAFAKKILDQSISGLEAGGENAYLSAAKTKKALEGLFVNNKNFATKLYGKDSVSVARQAIEELDKIANTQIATQNPSGSGQLVMRQLMRLPMLTTLREGVNFTVLNPIKTGKVIKSVDPVVNQIQSIKIKPQSRLFAATGGKIMAEKGVGE